MGRDFLDDIVDGAIRRKFNDFDDDAILEILISAGPIPQEARLNAGMD